MVNSSSDLRERVWLPPAAQTASDGLLEEVTSVAIPTIPAGDCDPDLRWRRIAPYF